MNTTVPTPTPTPTPTPIPIYPWTGGALNAFWYWEGNYASPSGSTTELTDQGWYTGVSSAQSSDLTTSNLIETTTGTFSYYGVNPYSSTSTFNFPESLNLIILFIGFSNANLAVGQYYAYNYTIGTQMLNDAYTYFDIGDITQTSNQLIGFSFGGGDAYTGGWTTGVPVASLLDASPENNSPGIGGIYSIYQQCTPSGETFSYIETGTGSNIERTGTGLCVQYTSITEGSYGNGTSYFGTNANGVEEYVYSLTQCNCLVFDIEDGNNSYTDYSTSSAEDFLNLFNYIKYNPNSVFYGKPPIIIVTISHSCSEGIGSTVISDLLSANPCYYDYISPQLYTCNIGTTTEYCANSLIPWSPDWSSKGTTTNTFTSLLQSNGNYSTNGLKMIIPSINYSNLYEGAGTTNPSPYYPNLYWYETDYSNQDAPPAPTTASSSAGTINYSVDNGAVGFFQAMFNSPSSELGGYIEWVNGSTTADLNSIDRTTADPNSIDPITQVAVSNIIINATPSNYYKTGYAFNNVSYYGSKTTFTMNSSNYITILSDGDPFPALAGNPTFTNDYSDNIARIWTEVPNPLTEQNYNYTFPYRGSTNTSNPQSFFDNTGMGVQGIFVNGAALYNPSSGNGTVPGTTISGKNKYYLNAVFFELQYGIDAAGGHPSPGGLKVNGKQGQHHYHDSMFLSSGAWNNTTFFGSNIYFSGTNYSGDYIRNTDGHSKILGICFDGYPIYGPYGYTSALDSNSTVILMKSSYVANATEFRGRPYTYTDYVSGYTISAGAFLDDYYYDSTVGTLDEYNGRYCVTPDYPNGTYAYFVTVDEASVPQFPYIIGPYSKQQRTVVNNGYSS